MRRAAQIGALCAALLGVATADARAQSYFELVWSATTGAGVPGGTEIQADPGDVVTVDVLVQVDADGLLFAGISLDYDTEALGSPVVAMCPTGCQGMSPFPPTLLPGSIRHIRVNTPAIPGPTTLHLASIDFTATGQPGSVDPFFVLEVDGILSATVEVNLSPLANPVSVTGPATIPALPGSAAHLLLGTALLLAARWAAT